MGLFIQSEGDVAIVVSNGVYKQVPVYLKDGLLYAGISGGFVRLKEDGSTSQPKMRLDHLDFDGDLHRDELGRLCVPSTERKSTPLAEPRRQLLIGSN